VWNRWKANADYTFPTRRILVRYWWTTDKLLQCIQVLSHWSTNVLTDKEVALVKVLRFDRRLLSTQTLFDSFGIPQDAAAFILSYLFSTAPHFYIFTCTERLTAVGKHLLYYIDMLVPAGRVSAAAAFTRALSTS
jgi:hypothetical protein